MTVYGIGVDIVRISRIARTFERFGARFTGRFLCDRECLALAQLDSEKRKHEFLAGRWAAKEAAFKALGKPLRSPRIPFTDIEVKAFSEPTRIEFHGHAKELVKEKAISRIHLSISHEDDYAVAQVLLEANYYSSA